MTLRVHDKTYDVILNGTDYVAQDEPFASDFEGVFTAYVDDEPYENMSLAGISHLEDGWHISLYELTPQQLWDNRVDAILEALLGGA